MPKITKASNSFVVYINKIHLEKAGFEPGDPVSIESRKGIITIRKVVAE